MCIIYRVCKVNKVVLLRPDNLSINCYFQRTTGRNAPEDGTSSRDESISNGHVGSTEITEPIKSQSNLVFGYLNLFSDGVVGCLQLSWFSCFAVINTSNIVHRYRILHSVWYKLMFNLAQHNFTDGVALGSAFLLYGSVGGWSRTLFLLAHELPQEVCFCCHICFF